MSAHAKNSERIAEYTKHRNKSDQRKEYQKKYKKTDKYRKKVNETQKKRRLGDPQFKMREILSARLRGALNGRRKAETTMALLGCNISFFKTYIESAFKTNMNWQNHGSGDGKWQLDHIVPCASFDLSDPEQQKKCFHYTNMQPLWAYENLQKSDKLDWNSASDEQA